MLNVSVLDSSAESRQAIVTELQTFIREYRGDMSLIPRVSVRPVARQELKFQDTPDILIVGDQIVRENVGELSSIRQLLPDVALIVRLPQELADLTTIEQLARYGVDDTFVPGTSGDEILRKLVLLGRRRKKKTGGRLVLVDGGKGGVGVTSVAAAVGELIAVQGKKVALVDFDCETQDLSRFLQSRPFINENLQLLLEEQRPINEEFVMQSLVQLFESGSGGLACMAPIAESEQLYSSGARYSRILVSILEVLDGKFDAVVVDAGSARGAILRTLYRVADSIVFVVSNDPANLFAAVDKLSRIRSQMACEATLTPVVNIGEGDGLDPALVRAEFSRAVGIVDTAWAPLAIPHCRQGRRWPGSGATLFGLGGRKLQRALDALVSTIGYETSSPRILGDHKSLAQILSSFFSRFHSTGGSGAQPTPNLSLTTNVEPASPSRAIEAPQLRLPQLLASTNGAGNLLSFPNHGTSRSESALNEEEALSVECLVSGANLS